MKYKDFLGNDIKTGDTIAYAVRDGNVATIKQAKVTELTTSTNRYSSSEEQPSLRLKAEDSDRKFAFYSLKNCIVISRANNKAIRAV